MSSYTPRIHLIRVPVEKIGDLIGPKGKHINAIIEETGVDISIEDDGLVSITSNDPMAMEKAKQWVYNMTRVNKVDDIVKVGDMIPVVVVEIDSTGRISLSHKATLKNQSGENSGPTAPSPKFEGPKPPRM